MLSIPRFDCGLYHNQILGWIRNILRLNDLYLFAYSISSNIFFFKLSISVKNKLVPLFLNLIIFLNKLFISFYKSVGTFNGTPSTVCTWPIYFSNVVNAFWRSITASSFAIFLIIIVLQNPYRSIFLSIIFWYLSTLELIGINP